MRKILLVSTVTMALGGSAMAAEAQFENNLTSTPMVSPAQLYQIEDLRTDFALGVLSTDYDSKPETGDKTATTVDTTLLFASGIYNVRSVGLRAGLTAAYGTGKSESKTGGTSYKGDFRDMIVSPQVAYPVGPVVIGAALDVYQTTSKPEEGEEISHGYNVFRPGVLYQANGLEAGLTYKTSASDEKKETEDGAETTYLVTSPSATALHARYAVSNAMAFGGIIEQTNYQGYDPDVLTAATDVTATGEFKTGAVRIEGDLGYNGAFYDGKENLTAGNMGSMEIGAAADYGLSKTANIGGGLNYTWGDGKDSNDTKYTLSAVDVLVRGDVKF